MAVVIEVDRSKNKKQFQQFINTCKKLYSNPLYSPNGFNGKFYQFYINIKIPSEGIDNEIEADTCRTVIMGDFRFSRNKLYMVIPIYKEMNQVTNYLNKRIKITSRYALYEEVYKTPYGILYTTNLKNKVETFSHYHKRMKAIPFKSYWPIEDTDIYPKLFVTYLIKKTNEN